MRLDRDGLGDAELARDAHPLADAVGGVVRHRRVAHESVGDERAEGRHRLFERGRRRRRSARSRGRSRRRRGAAAMPRPRRARSAAASPLNCGCWLTLVATVDALGAAAIASHSPMMRSLSPPSCARHPGAVGVGGVDEVATAATERVEDRERGVAVGRPAEHVAAEGEGKDVEVAASDAGHAERQRHAGGSIPVRVRCIHRNTNRCVPLHSTCNASEPSRSDTTARSAADACSPRGDSMHQAIDLAQGMDDLGVERRLLPRAPLRAAAGLADAAARRDRRDAPSASRSAPASSTCATRTRCTSPRRRPPSTSSATDGSRSA